MKMQGKHAVGAVDEPQPYVPKHCGCDHCWDAHLGAVVWGGEETSEHIVETVARR